MIYAAVCIGHDSGGRSMCRPDRRLPLEDVGYRGPFSVVLLNGAPIPYSLLGGLMSGRLNDDAGYSERESRSSPERHKIAVYEGGCLPSYSAILTARKLRSLSVVAVVYVGCCLCRLLSM